MTTEAQGLPGFKKKKGKKKKKRFTAIEKGTSVAISEPPTSVAQLPW
jgi:hypothetical protein